MAAAAIVALRLFNAQREPVPLINRPLGTAVIAIAVSLALAIAPAASAAPALPRSASVYSTGGYKHGLSLTLVISPSGRAIEQGGAALGSQFALSEGALQCPKARKNHGFREVPFTIFGFPGAVLRLSHGHYGFSKAEAISDTTPLGSSVKSFTLKLKIAGTVTSSAAIVGRVTAKGGPCTSRGSLRFKATLQPKEPVAPGQ